MKRGQKWAVGLGIAAAVLGAAWLAVAWWLPTDEELAGRLTAEAEDQWFAIATQFCLSVGDTDRRGVYGCPPYLHTDQSIADTPITELHRTQAMTGLHRVAHDRRQKHRVSWFRPFAAANFARKYSLKECAYVGHRT
jgi:hypothetical protein